MNRRELLKSTGGLVVAFALSPRELLARQGANAPDTRTLDPKQVDSALEIHPDGTVTVFTSKVDVGTGMRIAIAQMAAEELGVPTTRVSIVDGDTARCPNTGGTGGSTGLTRGGVAVRQAAATARHAVLALAAERLGRPVEELTVVDGVVQSTTGRSVGIGNLVGGRRLAIAVDPQAKLRAPDQYSRVGQSPQRPDVPAKCTGQYRYIQDFTVPGMLHARVLRPPTLGGTLLSVDESSIAHLPDVRVVRLENFLAVVAGDEWAALRASRELRAAWTDWKGLPRHDRLEPYLREGVVDRDQVIVHRAGGENAGTEAPEAAAAAVEAALTSSATRLSATYFWPCQSHASLAPSAAVADIKGDGGTLWTSSQVTYGLRNTLARVFGLVPEKLRVVFVEGSGSYGTNGADHAAADAVLISKTLGRPVRVQWSREDEHAWDPKGPQQLLDLRAGLDDTGKITAWDTEMWIPTNRRGARMLLAAEAARIPQDSGRDAAAVFENGDPMYPVGRLRVLAHWMRDTPLNPSNLRAPGKPGNVFAVEGLADEIAASLRVDALEFRRSRLSDPRALDVLARGGSAFGWKPRPSPNPDRADRTVVEGRGVAYVRYKGAENYIATFIEVAVDRSSGRINVKRVVCAHDCGLVVNPDALRNQIEGAIVQGLSRALHEEVQFDESRVTSTDWATYPILRFPEAPAIEVILVERREETLWGGGEASTVPVAAALGNAVFDATGVRLRRVPFTAEKVRAALA